jgi:hypothetical protein
MVVTEVTVFTPPSAAPPTLHGEEPVSLPVSFELAHHSPQHLIVGEQ